VRLGRSIHALPFYIGAFRPDRSNFFKHKREKELPLVDDRVVTSFELMTFDQATTDGNGQSMNHAATVECGYSTNELENMLILVSGDQLSWRLSGAVKRFRPPLPFLCQGQHDRQSSFPRKPASRYHSRRGRGVLYGVRHVSISMYAVCGRNGLTKP
jgi:hypothetical protein